MPALSQKFVGDWSRYGALSEFSEVFAPEWKTAFAEITYDTRFGRKMVSFKLDPADPHEMCRLSLSDGIAEDMIFTVNGQAVKGGVRCDSYTDTGSRYYIFWPYSQRGADFITRTFKNATSDVLISTPLVDFYMSAIGFTREWNGLGSDAL